MLPFSSSVPQRGLISKLKLSCTRLVRNYTPKGKSILYNSEHGDVSLEDRIVESMISRNQVCLLNDGRTGDRISIIRRVLFQLVRSDSINLYQQFNMQRYSSSAPEPATMFSLSYRTQNSRANALSCYGQYAIGAPQQKNRLHRKGRRIQLQC